MILDPLSWTDIDGDEFEIATEEEGDASIIACVGAFNHAERAHASVFIRVENAHALIAWLQQRLEQPSTAQSSGAILDVPTDTEQRH